MIYLTNDIFNKFKQDVVFTPSSKININFLTYIMKSDKFVVYDIESFITLNNNNIKYTEFKLLINIPWGTTLVYYNISVGNINLFKVELVTLN